MSFHNVLVPVDFSDSSSRAVRLATSLAPGGAITLLHVALAPELYYGDVAAYGFVVPETSLRMREEVQAESRRALEKLRREELAPGLDVRVLLREGPASEEIVDEAAKGYDLVVMGTHGRTGIKRALLGSVAERVIRHCAVPVLVTR